MKLKLAISGGQTGADQQWLKEAKARGIQTGGWAPKHFRTQEGPAPWLATEYGLKEHSSDKYQPRTWANVRDSQATIWFGHISPGFYCTKEACTAYEKPFIVNPTKEQFLEALDQYEVINGAGNRAEKNPQAAKDVEEAFSWLTS